MNFIYIDALKIKTVIQSMLLGDKSNFNKTERESGGERVGAT